MVAAEKFSIRLQRAEDAQPLIHALRSLPDVIAVTIAQSAESPYIYNVAVEAFKSSRQLKSLIDTMVLNFIPKPVKMTAWERIAEDDDDFA
jgi:hypothetical protein